MIERKGETGGKGKVWVMVNGKEESDLTGSEWRD